VTKLQWVAHGNQIGGALGSLDACESSYLKGIAFGIGGQGGEDCRGELDKCRGGGSSPGGLLALTSTMLAFPEESKCESCGFEGLGMGSSGALLLFGNAWPPTHSATTPQTKTRLWGPVTRNGMGHLFVLTLPPDMLRRAECGQLRRFKAGSLFGYDQEAVAASQCG